MGITMLSSTHLASTTSILYTNDRTGEQFIRPTDIGISFQDSLDKFKFQASPIIKACKNIEEIENKLTQSYLGTSGV